MSEDTPDDRGVRSMGVTLDVAGRRLHRHGISLLSIAGWAREDRLRAMKSLIIGILVGQSLLAFFRSEAVSGLVIREDLPDRTWWVIPTVMLMSATVWWRARYPGWCAALSTGTWVLTHVSVIRQSFADFALVICAYSVGRYGTKASTTAALGALAITGVGAIVATSVVAVDVDIDGAIVAFIQLLAVPALIGLGVRQTVTTASGRPSSPPGNTSLLSDRERSVVELIARGYSNAEIAYALHLSVETVKTHVSRSLSKLGLRDRLHVAVWYHTAGSSSPSTSSTVDQRHPSSE
ncbi:MAG: response regulator transcription factor [Dermatophilaceae bacterium]